MTTPVPTCSHRFAVFIKSVPCISPCDPLPHIVRPPRRLQQLFPNCSAINLSSLNSTRSNFKHVQKVSLQYLSRIPCSVLRVLFTNPTLQCTQSFLPGTLSREGLQPAVAGRQQAPPQLTTLAHGPRIGREGGSSKC